MSMKKMNTNNDSGDRWNFTGMDDDDSSFCGGTLPDAVTERHRILFKKLRKRKRELWQNLSRHHKLLAIASFYKCLAHKINPQMIEANVREEALKAFQEPNINIESEYNKIHRSLQPTAQSIVIENGSDSDIMVISENDVDQRPQSQNLDQGNF